MQNLFRNIRYGIRNLVASPILTLTVLLTLAVGIGATTAIFTVDYAALLADLPYPQPNQASTTPSPSATIRIGSSKVLPSRT
jgi:hypothetical protein